MSTLKTHNLQSPDASSVNIAMASNAGIIVTGVSTFSADVTFTGNNYDAVWNKSVNQLQFGDNDTISVEALKNLSEGCLTALMAG